MAILFPNGEYKQATTVPTVSAEITAIFLPLSEFSIAVRASPFLPISELTNSTKSVQAIYFDS